MRHQADSRPEEALLGEIPLPEWQALYVSHYVFSRIALKDRRRRPDKDSQ